MNNNSKGHNNENFSMKQENYEEELLRMETNPQVSAEESNFWLNQNIQKKISKQAIHSLNRCLIILFLYCFGKSLPYFLLEIIIFLFVHEGLVFTNFIVMLIYISVIDPYVHKIFLNINTINEGIYFLWVLYIIYKLFSDYSGLEQSWKSNPFLICYILILVILEFFSLFKFFFYIIGLILCCPCITYIFIKEFRDEYLNIQRARKIQEKLKGIPFNEYTEAKGKEIDCCVICREDFKEESNIVILPCNDMHIFHEKCIKAWIMTKTTCPICRQQLSPEEEVE